MKTKLKRPWPNKTKLKQVEMVEVCNLLFWDCICPEGKGKAKGCPHLILKPKIK